MRIILKYYLIIIFSSFWVLSINAQNEHKKRFQHQLELGFNYGINFGNRINFTGIGDSYNNFYSNLTNFINPFNSITPLNNYKCYKLILNEKHILKFNFLRNDLRSNRNIKPHELSSLLNEIYGLGYGYIFKYKNINFTLNGQACERTGYEVVFLQELFDFNNFTGLKYNSYGLSLGIDVDYFFSKNFGLGTNINYYNFWLEKGKLTEGNVKTIDPVFVLSYKPITEFVNIAFKLTYKFSLPKLKK